MKNNISFNSELCKFGIGLFETIKVTNRPIDFDIHMDRIFNSIKELNLNIKLERKFIENEILNYIENNNIINKALRLTVFDEGYNISTRDILYTQDMYKKGFKLNISPIIICIYSACTILSNIIFLSSYNISSICATFIAPIKLLLMKIKSNLCISFTFISVSSTFMFNS